ncbi:MAG TPA: acyclic terpene utilization AtuA family protein [Gemmatimonadaceae bacterium]|nr:acyclic terpene utilization AtuA family protein [Gemmatimonadaceae bacterium]
MSRVVRVASGQGFWGDWLEAPRRQVDGGPIDYLMLDYLAEVTMSILQKQKERDPSMGYARDFIGAMESVFPALVQRGVRVVANAGGVNPPACAAAVRAAADRAGVAGKLRVGVVTGDDLLPRLDALIAGGHPLANMETGEPLESVRARVLSANAYLGALPIVQALAQDANIVITGRSTDTALTMAPLLHEFHWGMDDWNRLAAGIVAGHIIECGAQCSGGNCLYDWRTIPDLANIGYPIIEASPDGTFVVTKHSGTGGRIDIHSVTEQLVYEMGDPHDYITPDVIADFTTIHLEDAGTDRVRVSGITGRPPTDKLKVSIAYRSGYKALGTLVYAWPDALEKAELADRVLRERLDRLGLHFDAIHTEFLGASATHGPLAMPEADAASHGGMPAERQPARAGGSRQYTERQRDIPEVQLRIGVRGSDRAAVERFTREIAPLVLNGPPSVTGFAGGRPKVEEVVAYWPALIDKRVVSPCVTMEDA